MPNRILKLLALINNKSLCYRSVKYAGVFKKRIILQMKSAAYDGQRL
jgi:hypothetical protein